MSFVTEILTPIIQALVYFGMVGGVIFFGNRGLNKLNPYWKLDVKYKLFRKKYNPEHVKWCMDAIEKEYGVVAVEKHLLIHNFYPKKRKEIVYIFLNIQRELSKGRKSEENEWTKRSNEQNQIPEIK